MKQLTPNQLACLTAILDSDYRSDGPLDEVWSCYDLLPALPYARSSHGGIMACLVKAGLVICSDAGNYSSADTVVSLTAQGAALLGIIAPSV